eukprot:gene57442-biopygen96592
MCPGGTIGNHQFERADTRPPLHCVSARRADLVGSIWPGRRSPSAHPAPAASLDWLIWALRKPGDVPTLRRHVMRNRNRAHLADLGQVCASSRSVRSQFWARSGPVLGHIWVSSGPALDLFCANCGPECGHRRARLGTSSGPDLGSGRDRRDAAIPPGWRHINYSEKGLGLLGGCTPDMRFDMRFEGGTIWLDIYAMAHGTGWCNGRECVPSPQVALDTLMACVMRFAWVGPFVTLIIQFVVQFIVQACEERETLFITFY